MKNDRNIGLHYSIDAEHLGVAAHEAEEELRTLYGKEVEIDSALKFQLSVFAMYDSFLANGLFQPGFDKEEEAQATTTK